MHASTGRGVGQAGAVSDSLITGGSSLSDNRLAGRPRATGKAAWPNSCSADWTRGQQLRSSCARAFSSVSWLSGGRRLLRSPQRRTRLRASLCVLNLSRTQSSTSIGSRGALTKTAARPTSQTQCQSRGGREARLGAPLLRKLVVQKPHTACPILRLDSLLPERRGCLPLSV